MSTSWHNFFFAAFDPGGFISVDKPPVALWIESLSARIFGFSAWSLLLPSALAGAASVGLLWRIVRRHFGAVAATIAALVLALSPINVAVNRLNLPDPFLVLFLIAAVWAIERSFHAEKWMRWLVVAGLFIGLGFNTKMLAAAIPVPALALGLFLGAQGRIWDKTKRVALFGLACLAFSVPWMIAVDLTPASSRPYVGGSTNNSVADLVFGYNGLGRVDGNGQGFGGRGPIGGGGVAGPGGVFGGAPGTWRLFDDAVGPQVAWLIPLALGGVAVAIWAYRRDRLRRSSVVLWLGWAGLHAVVFSYAKGTFHSYYTSALAPGIAALVGIGGAALVGLIRSDRRWLWGAGAGALATVLLQRDLSGRVSGFYRWTTGVVIGLVVAATIVVLVGVARRHRGLLVGGLGVALAALLFTPAAWAVSEAANPTLNATLPQAGPRSGVSGQTFGSSAFDANAQLAAFLQQANVDGERWDLVVSSAQGASDFIATYGLSVMALGGFLGSDPAATVASFAAMVERGEVRYVLTGQGGPGGFGFGGPAGGFPGAPGGTNRFRGGTNGFPGGNGSPFPNRVAPANPPTGGVPGGSNTGPGSFTGRPGRFGGGGPGGFGRGTSSQILEVVAQACTPVTATTAGGSFPSQYQGSLFDCAGHGADLAALA